MDTDQINKIMMSNSVTRGHYQGCFPSDQIPPFEELRFPAAIVFNLDDSDGEGTHWTCAFVKENEVNYFDSYAIEPQDEILKFLNQFPRIIRNIYPYQSLTTNVCGHYCITFLYYLCSGITFDSFLKILDRCENKDLFVRKIVKNMIQ
jgi:hypothetical protein